MTELCHERGRISELPLLMTLEGCFKLSIATKLRDCPLSVLIVNSVGEFHLFLILLDDRQMVSGKDVSINLV